ncbi:nitrogen fixation protein NifQ, partial [Klebsiella pneumoniae]
APGAEPMAPIVAGAALAFNHLGADLGLDSRAERGRLMRDCFPQLVAQNVHHMRWKKFFYRQRCLQSQGEIVCRSPSCD